MKHIILAFFLAMGCSVRVPPVIDLPIERLSLSLVGKHSMAHACAVENRILTASHVAAPIIQGRETPLSYTWDDGVRKGWLTVKQTANARDLAQMDAFMGDTPRYLTRGESPQPGDEIKWYEYRYDEGAVLGVTRRSAKVERLRAGHIVIDQAVAQGASGGCLLDSTDSVVGVVIWTFDTTGVAVDLTGSWWPF